MINYYEAEEKYRIQIDKDGLSAGYDYFIETGEYSNEWSNQDSTTVKVQLCNMFETEDDTVYEKAVLRFETILKDRFDVTPEELYALPIK